MASRAAARRRSAGAVGVLAVLFALTTTGAWAGTEAPQDSPTTAPTEPTPSESPSPDPTQTAEPSPSPTPTVTESPSPSPTPAEAPDDEGEDSEDSEDSEDEDSDEDSDDDSDEDDSEDQPAPDDEPTTDEPGDPTTDASPPSGSPGTIDLTTGEPQRYIPAGLRFVAADEEYNRADASFIATPDSGLAPLTVSFTNESTCDGEEEECSYYWWNFGNGQTSDEEDPPDVTYVKPGTYQVSLTVKYVEFFSFTERAAAAAEDSSPSCGLHEDEISYRVHCDTATKSVTLTGPPDASFTAVPSSGPAPLSVKFKDTSTGDIGSRSWAFNGPACGDASATAKQFSETFTTVGKCKITLTVESPPLPGPEPEQTDGPEFSGPAVFDPGCNCEVSSASKTITVTKAPVIAPTPTPGDDDDSDNDDGDSNDSDDDGDDVTGVFLPPNQPPLTDEPSPEPTEPSPAPTQSAKPTTTTPTETVDPKPASWITGEGAPAAGIALMILAAVIGSLGGLSMAGRRVALVADRDENTIQRHVAARDAEGWGDRSFTWRFPGHRLIDAASVVLPDRLFRFSPLVGRIAEDGSEFRAMFGTLWLATPLAGIALGLASAAAAGGRALPPSAWLVMAGAVLATFDAFSGALAVTLFAGAALVGGLGAVEGGPDTVHSLLVILAIGFLWMAIPLIGSAIRPFRRLGDGSLRHRWDVVGDGLIAALLCGWVAQKLTQAMDLFAGQKTGLPEHANTVALVVMGAVGLRVAMEHFSVSAYPLRLQQVEGEDPPPPLLISSILGAFIRTAIFGFIGYAFIGSCWQLWLGIGLFFIPQLIDHIREAFPNVGMVRRILPRGVVEIFILVVACTLAARFAMSEGGGGLTGLRLAFLLIAVPPALLGVLRAVAEDPDESGNTTWPREILGAVIVAVTAVLAARGWDY